MRETHVTSSPACDERGPGWDGHLLWSDAAVSPGLRGTGPVAGSRLMLRGPLSVQQPELCYWRQQSLPRAGCQLAGSLLGSWFSTLLETLEMHNDYTPKTFWKFLRGAVQHKHRANAAVLLAGL